MPVAPMAPTTRVGTVSGARSVAAISQPGVKVELSSSMSALRDAARAKPYGEVRADVVAQAKADIASGRLGSREDVDRTIDAFLQAM